MIGQRLPDLEQTLGDLVLDLLRAPRLYPELIHSDPLDARGEVSPDSVRVTQHYISGLLAYGFSADHEELRAAADWFATPFPTEQHPRMDSVEMNRLEALLQLRPADPTVLPRLEQLARQQTMDGDNFVVEAGGRDFDTLWALKVMALAMQRGVLNGIIDYDRLRHLAGRMVRNHQRDKDLALALYLRSELAGSLRQSQKRYLDRLLDMARRTGGMWGIEQDMIWLVEHMKHQQLTPGDVSDYRDAFREMILGTCYVVENLAPFMAEDSELQSMLGQALDLWWGAFHGRNAVETLHALFPMPYDYLLILSRTLVALRAYLNEPLIAWGGTHVHRRLAAQQSELQAEPPERESIKKTLRNWLRVDLDGEMERLRRGMSDSDIVRVRPRVWNPMFPDDEEARLRIPMAESVVIKYSRAQDIAQERENYNEVPPPIRDCFVRIPQPIYTDEQGRAFVVMQDLYRFRTLDEIMRKVPQARESVNDELGPFIIRMHRAEGRAPRPAQHGALWDLYLMPMQDHLGRIFHYIEENGLLDEKTQRERANVLRLRLLDLIGSLVRAQPLLEGFPLAYMHGDLHSRNIMARLLKQRERGAQGRELEFRLIDLEKLRRDGDCALDAGELLADLQLALAPLKGTSDRRPLEALMEAVRASYDAFAQERSDDTFDIRVEMAQARALIRVGKGRTKYGLASLRESRRSPAISVAYEILGYAEQAADHLDVVGRALRRLEDKPGQSPALHLQIAR